MNKACTRCGTVYPSSPDYFNRDKKRVDGLHPYCKICKKEQHQTWLSNPDNKRKKEEKTLQWQKENPIQMKKHQKDYRERKKKTTSL